MDPRLITRREAIGGLPLVVLDGLFDAEAIATLYGFLGRVPYHLNDIDTEETSYSRHWKSELLIPLALATPVLRECAALPAAMFPDAGIELRRAHVNLHLYGDLQFPHTDVPGGVTALYYANPRWDEKWQGETIFYDARREPLITVAPRPGRVVVFDADIVHRAGVPSRECFEPRLSVAFKCARTRPRPAP